MNISAQAVQNIRRARLEKGISAQVLSDAINDRGNWSTSRGIIANLESERRTHVSVDYVVEAAAVLGIPVQWVIFGAITCDHCNGEPPAGYACLHCQRARKS